MGKIRTHYDNLQVSRNASPEVIKAAYKSLSQKHHPDKNRGNPEAGKVMAIINSAYQTLSDPEKRQRYDEQIDQMEQKAQAETHAHNYSPGISPKKHFQEWLKQVLYNMRKKFIAWAGVSSFQEWLKQAKQALYGIGIIALCLWLLSVFLPRSTPKNPKPTDVVGIQITFPTKDDNGPVKLEDRQTGRIYWLEIPKDFSHSKLQEAAEKLIIDERRKFNAASEPPSEQNNEALMDVNQSRLIIAPDGPILVMPNGDAITSSGQWKYLGNGNYATPHGPVIHLNNGYYATPHGPVRNLGNGTWVGPNGPIIDMGGGIVATPSGPVRMVPD